jgi:hypothetical protein
MVAAQFNGLRRQSKVVISGAMRTWETGGGISETTNMAEFVRLALKRILNERWSIVIYMYDKFTEEAGCGSCFHYEDNWWIYGVPTVSTSCDDERILSLLEDGFGWRSVIDVHVLQNAVEKAIIGRFGEGWRVHIAKLPPGSHRSSSIYGPHWEHDGYHFWVMRRSPF